MDQILRFVCVLEQSVHVFGRRLVRCDSTHRTRGGGKAFDAPAFRVGQVEMLLAFLDDIHIASMPDKVSEAHAKPKCGIVVVWSLRSDQKGKTGEARRSCVEGDQLPPNQQGLEVFGVPIGQSEFLRAKNMPLCVNKDCQTRVDGEFRRSLTLLSGGV